MTVESPRAQRARHAESAPLDPPRDLAVAELGVWVSSRMQEVYDIARQAASADVTVLITGETGTGKGVVARAVHRLGPRRSGPFVSVNCAAIGAELLETELFGHERGAFTGAHQLKIGKFEVASGGTIVLDEIGELHPLLQAKLLHVLEDGEISRVGGLSPVKIDVRVIAATNQNLEAAVAAGRFREDLYYRLNVVRIEVPPLRERPEDILLLADHFVERFSIVLGRQPFALTADLREEWQRYPFPGNVRELENLVKRMIVLRGSEGEVRFPSVILPNGRITNAEGVGRPSLRDISRNAARAAERTAIMSALRQTGWNRFRAARLLRVSYRALLGKIRLEGIGEAQNRY